jgi:hypothetical protein
MTRLSDRQIMAAGTKVLRAEQVRHDAMVARDAMIRRAVAEGRTKAEVAKLAGITKARVGKIVGPDTKRGA